MTSPSPISSISSSSAELQNRSYSGMFVQRSRSPSPSLPAQIMRITDSVRLQTAPNVFTEVAKDKIRPQFAAEDTVLARHPDDAQGRYFIGKICAKSKDESLKYSNYLKIFWIAVDGTEVPGFIKRHDRGSPMIERIHRFHPNLITGRIATPFQMPDTDKTLAGYQPY